MHDSPSSGDQFYVGCIFEDCRFHPVVCTLASVDMDELQGTRTVRPITPSTALAVPSLHQLTSITSVTVVHATPHQAPLASHEAIRREQHEAEAMERLSAEYLTLA